MSCMGNADQSFAAASQGVEEAAAEASTGAGSLNQAADAMSAVNHLTGQDGAKDTDDDGD